MDRSETQKYMVEIATISYSRQEMHNIEITYSPIR